MAEAETLRETPLADLHRALGARMVPFAGYAMPVQFSSGILAEHAACRSHAALFDVSHMGQAELLGEGAAAALEALMPADLLGLKPGRQRYALLTSEQGGILDDCMVANLGERLFLVVNAANKEADFDRIAAHLPPGLRLRRREDRALLALQGPRAAELVAALAPALPGMAFLDALETEIAGVPAIVSRSGYTGEDGYEISLPGEEAEGVVRALLAIEGIAPAGLGARDSLRLEAGLCLHGQDIDAGTNPIEAGLGWTIGKRRRLAWDFCGAEAIREILANGPRRQRVGLRPEGRQPARAGVVIRAGGEAVGAITSGGFGPSVNAPIAMGYVTPAHAQDGATLSLDLRGKPVPATVVPLPFTPHRYIR